MPQKLVATVIAPILNLRDLIIKLGHQLFQLSLICVQRRWKISSDFRVKKGQASQTVLSIGPDMGHICALHQQTGKNIYFFEVGVFLPLLQAVFLCQPRLQMFQTVHIVEAGKQAFCQNA